MVDKASLEPEKEKLLPAGDSDSQQQQLRVSPEFTRAADLIDKVAKCLDGLNFGRRTLIKD